MITLKTFRFNTPLGSMIAIADEEVLYLLEFADNKNLGYKITKLRHKIKAEIVTGSTEPIKSIEFELKAYFDGQLKEFKTPLRFLGSAFQQNAWKELQRIAYGSTRSYKQQAEALGTPLAYRALANANGANRLAIIVPCHRIINNNGDIGGYNGGVDKKKWLLDFEKQHN